LRKKSTAEWVDYLKIRLAEHHELGALDPQSNSIRLLAYDLSRFIETRELAFRDVEEIIKILSDQGAISRAALRTGIVLSWLRI